MSDPGDRLLDRVEIVMVATLVLAFVIGAVDAVLAGWTSVSDDALIELLVRDVPGQLPLVGVYSRYGWSHPGPRCSTCLRCRTGWPARTRSVWSWGRWPAAAGRPGHLGGVCDACTASPRWSCSRRCRCCWPPRAPPCCAAPEPPVALVGSALLLALAWSASVRSKVGLVGLLSVGTLLVQSHVVTAPLVVVTVATAAVVALQPWAVHHGPRGTAGGSRRRGGCGAGSAWWIPPSCSS